LTATMHAREQSVTTRSKPVPRHYSSDKTW
jgi:hypothetical protein